jgi:hypothetical protein
MYLIDEGNPMPFPFASSKKVIHSLIDKGWIAAEDMDAKYLELTFTGKSLHLFEQEDLFQEFHDLFPVRVPDSTGGWRPVSSATTTTKSAQTARHLWIKNVGKDAGKQRSVIEALRKELKHREKYGKLQFINNIHTWLRQAKWEDWLDVPDTPDSSSKTKQL